MVFEGELHQSRSLRVIVDPLFYRVRVPTEREQLLRFKPFDSCIPFNMLVARECDLGCNCLACYKLFSLKVNSEPTAKLLGLDQRLPDPFVRGFEQDFSFNAIMYVHKSPPSLTVGHIDQCATFQYHITVRNYRRAR